MHSKSNYVVQLVHIQINAWGIYNTELETVSIIVRLLYNSGIHSAVKQYNYYLHCEGFTHTIEIVKVQELRVELQC